MISALRESAELVPWPGAGPALATPVAVGVLARGAAPAPGGVLAALFPGSVLAGFPPSASVGVGGRRSRLPAVAGFVWFSLRLHSEEAVFWCTHLG